MLGNVIGSAIGLIAILLGALWNARLTRKRDDRIMTEEAKSIAAAIGAEMSVHIEFLTGRFAQVFVGPEGRSAPILESLRQPKPLVWPNIAPQIGKLDYDLSYRAVKAWALIEAHASILGATITEMQEGQWDVGKVRHRVDALKGDLPSICATVAALTGRDAPDLEYALP